MVSAETLSGMIDAYIAALPIVPIAIIPGPGGLSARLGIMRTADAMDALWFKRSHHAEIVATACLEDFRELGAILPNGFIDLNARTVRDYVVNSAGVLGANWSTDAEIRHSASFEVEKIIINIEVQRRTGGLAEINAVYKQKRIEAAKLGKKTVSYAAHLADFTRSMVQLAASNAGA